MFRQMRRNRQQLSWERCEEILSRATSGVLAVLGDEGYPYAVPLSYVYSEGKFYFHCARQGHYFADKSEETEQPDKDALNCEPKLEVGRLCADFDFECELYIVKHNHLVEIVNSTCAGNWN